MLTRLERFLTPDSYIEQVSSLYGKEGLRGLNCLAYAFGETKPDFDHWRYELTTHDPDGFHYKISTAFEWEAKKHGISIKEVSHTEPGHFYIRVYGWFWSSYFIHEIGDFHVVLVFPDGTLAHKLGWGLAPTVTSEGALKEEYPEKYLLYEVI